LPEKQHLPEGSAFVALDATNLPELKEAAIKTVEGRHVAFVDLRTGVSRLGHNESGIVSEARSLIDWNKRNRFCPSCGNATVSVWAGWKKACIADDSRPACITKKGVHNVVS
jgi:NAD+ diphosphatase